MSKSDTPNTDSYSYSDAAGEEASLWIRYFIWVFGPIRTAWQKLREFIAVEVTSRFLAFANSFRGFSITGFLLGLVRLVLGVTGVAGKRLKDTQSRRALVGILIFLTIIFLTGVYVLGFILEHYLPQVTQQLNAILPFSLEMGVLAVVILITSVNSFSRDINRIGSRYIPQTPTQVEYLSQRKVWVYTIGLLLSSGSFFVFVAIEMDYLSVGTADILSLYTFSLIGAYAITKLSVHDLRDAMRRQYKLYEYFELEDILYTNRAPFTWTVSLAKRGFHPFVWNMAARISVIGSVTAIFIDGAVWFIFAPSALSLLYLLRRAWLKIEPSLHRWVYEPDHFEVVDE